MRGRLLRCGGAAGAALTGDVAVLAVLIEALGLGYLTASAAGFGAGISLFYLLAIGRGGAGARRRAAVAVPILAGIALAGLALTVLAMLILVEAIGLGYLEAKALTALATAIFAVTALSDVIFTPGAGSTGRAV